MTLNTKVKFKGSFALRPAIVELKAILAQVHCMTQMTLNTKRSKVRYIFVNNDTDHEFQSSVHLVL